MTDTTTATVSPWPIAEATLASCPHLAWLWQDGPARPATEAELKAYADRRDDPDDILCDATSRAVQALTAVSAHAPAPSAEPSHPHCAACARDFSVLEPEPGIGELDEGRQEAMDRFHAAFGEDPDGDGDRGTRTSDARPDTAVIPVTDARTETFPAAVGPEVSK